jgi:hypothetical protein
MVGVISLITGIAGPSGFGSASTADQVTKGIDASNLTIIITGQWCKFEYVYLYFYRRIIISTNNHKF